MSHEDDLLSQLEESALTRSDLLKRAAVLGVSVPTLGLLDGQVAQAYSSATRQRRRAGGVLRIGTSDNFTSFSPWKDAYGNYPFFNNLYGQPLRDVNQPRSGQPLPWLATSVDVASNARSVTVRLRRGVTFHHGDPLDATALIANWEAISDPKRSDFAGNWVPFFGEARRINALTAQLRFTHATAPTLVRELHARMSLVSPSLLKKGDKAMLTQADGTGAFMLTSYKQGVSAVLTRNPDYWVDGLPHLDRIEFHYFRDPNAMTAAFQSGELDMVMNLPPQNVSSLSRQFRIVAGPESISNSILLNCRPSRPFARLESRHALQYLVNRKRFVDQALFGRGTVTYTHAPPTSLGWDPKFRNAFPYNPDKAKAMFQRLGMLGASKPIEVVQLTGIIPAIGRNAEILAEEMNAIGLKAELVPVDIAVWVSRFLGDRAGSYDILTSSDGTVNRYPILQTAGNTGSKVEGNPSFAGGRPPAAYRNAIRQATFARTPAEQRKWSRKFVEIQLDQSFDIAVAYQPTQYAMKKSLSGFGIGRDDWLILERMRFTG